MTSKKILVLVLCIAALASCSASAFALDQWASSAIAQSSRYSAGDDMVDAIGAPDANAWWEAGTSAEWSTTGPWLTMGYTTPVYATGVTVERNWGYLAVTSIQAVKMDDTLVTMWSGTDPYAGVGSQATPISASYSWAQTDYLVKGVRLNIEPMSNRNSWYAVDAIQLSGVEAPPVPEPSALLALGTGLLGIAGVTFRSKK